MSQDLHQLVAVIEWLLAGLFSVVVAVVGFAFRAGRKMQGDAEMKEDIAEIKKAVKPLPKIRADVEQLKEFQTRMTSDFPKLREQVNVTAAKLGLTPHAGMQAVRRPTRSSPTFPRIIPEDDEEEK